MVALPGRRGWEARCERFAAQLSTRIERLRKTCLSALAPFWEDPSRSAAYRQARGLTRLCRAYGLTDVARTTRALSSLLRIPREEVIELQPEVEERVREILALLDRALKIERRIA